MSIGVDDLRGARWVRLLQLLGMHLTYDRKERPWWSTATILGDSRRTAFAVVDVAALGYADRESVLTDLFEHAADSSWDGDIWVVAAGRLVLPGLDSGWGPEFRCSGWIAQYMGDREWGDGWASAPAPWAHCASCGGTVVFHPVQSFLCTPNGCYDSGDNFEPAGLDELRMSWEEAAFGPLR
ncbi:MAG: hypothetical protein ACRDS9_29010 [Pseudonocardiaceae bacterium]